jgi:steroid 5-alpha reductase family enzyme
MAALNDWFLSLGAQYGVNPYIFGAIYVGAIPFFLASIAWLVRRRRAGRSIVVPVLCAGFCFVSAYLYLAIAGRNIPVWVWGFLALLIIYGAWSTIRDVRRKISAPLSEEGHPPA